MFNKLNICVSVDSYRVSYMQFLILFFDPGLKMTKHMRDFVYDEHLISEGM